MGRLTGDLYELHIPRLLWNFTLDSVLQSMYFFPMESKPCLYMCHDPKNGFMAPVIYVDDIILCAEKMENHDEFIKKMSERFLTKSTGFPSPLL
eukprot:Ihof_evm4s320 gene=Ihof_evmTU4s320